MINFSQPEFALFLVFKWIANLMVNEKNLMNKTKTYEFKTSINKSLKSFKNNYH